MDTSDLRIALFSGNYNMVFDGANRALNRLTEYLLRQGARVRVYSPTIEAPAFKPQGPLVSLPSVAIPTRGEYRVPLGLNGTVRGDLERYDPNILHIASPDFSARAAMKWAKKRGLPVLASVHTRFETYPRYYHLGALEPVVEAYLRNLYRQCDALVTPSEGMVDTLREQRMHDDIGIWSRGVDHDTFNPGRRSLEWRRSLGIADDEVAIGWLGRLVLEKGIDIFGETIAELKRRGVRHRVLVIGEGPARETFEEAVPHACFVGFQQGDDLGRAVASMDILLNPSITETFGNVTLEAMACGVPVVAADATGAGSLVIPGETGWLVGPRKVSAYADRLQAYIADAELRRAHGSAGAKRAEAFTWDAINQTVADTYLRLIAANRAT